MSEQDIKARQSARYDMMVNQPLGRVIPKIAVPSIISMMVSMFYNMADTFFVSKINTAATAAVGINVSLMFIIQAIGMTFASGCMSYISRLLGMKQQEKASRVMATGFFSAFFLNVLFAIGGLIFMDPLMRMLGATESILPYARDYASYILIGAPFIGASFVMDSSLRGEGMSKMAMIGVTVGAVLNVGLDPLFIFTFGMGTGGAALATIISQIIGFCVLISMYLRKKSILKLSIKNVTFNWDIYGEILKIGFPAFLRVALTSLSTIVLNNVAGAFGDAAIAAMSIHSRVVMFSNSALIGFGQGYSPVAGFNHGANRPDRVWKSFWFTVTTAVIGTVVVGVIVFIFAPQIMLMFRDDPDVISVGIMALRFHSLSMPVQAINVISNMTFSALGHGPQAAAMAFSRQGLFFIPAALILPGILGITGVELIPTVADCCALIITLILIIPFLIKLKGSVEGMPRPEAAVSEV